ncbi:NADH dehydrogenase (ubiquinone) 1 alpha subcomplex 9 [Cryptococcus deuterogattii 99/473]|uniref:NADH dehydrogenase (Ubiquinone) 1 alpha subcomplex 9 n=2 Tax=Cryptococcus deuterogattii TaxID=1859096 RepID=A0A0D0VCT7_9TREE|nr:NADH dehydrogenase (ubiquinone) 1 alpha subcomplex 9 [Cryptococcus deuterogattii R265]KIR29653.1 NADH dehydrogenase (ubiquinone) 1 alpha subcomplex 9 [Cryptococcus deuterogattii LA55]KIR36415.1 NADH dehydrogenase (ubiquinone) 1 alpha subcomplex 9 [Cryptococcus deuterogattii MMRL2647]KIR42630.1 NADH dehydrogenase (ubiquinone) 1 alpha subcomplex 9 [Cryptococcus deuterogattii Ram5]KIR75846.1 NADH dehydrogenase (ubiquinone) 1 alpha subcomplex 9 [Cryptococcus deuterogattii CA1014]KIR95788.1 NADH
MSILRVAPALRAKAVPRVASLVSKRNVNDLSITSPPNPSASVRPAIRYGPPTGGRSSDSGRTVTVFGSTGFLARYLIQKLARQGTQVIVPYRDEDEKRRLRPCGDLGQIVPLEWDARIPEQTAECVKHADVVYNLVGRDYETRNYSYDDVNVKVAQSIAEISADMGIPRLIHVSHINANPESTSEFYRTKYAGERAVRDAFPEATIVRPSQLFGHEDWLLNAIARFPILAKLNNGNTKFFPVHVVDVAQALNLMFDAPVTSTASTFVLPGPELYTYGELEKLVSALTLRPLSSAPSLPKPVAKFLANLVNRGLWWPTISPDEVERMFINDAGADTLQAHSPGPDGWNAPPKLNIVGVDGEPVKSWADLDMQPDTIAEHAIKPLRRYRSTVNYDLPVETHIIKSPKQYHVLP